MSWFYNGIWAVRPVPTISKDAWTAPGNEKQWIVGAQGFEDLNISWEEFDLLPEEMFSGQESWTEVTFAGSSTTEFYITNALEFSRFYIDPFDMVPTRFYVDPFDMVPTRFYVDPFDMVPTRFYIDPFDMVPTRFYVDPFDMTPTRFYINPFDMVPTTFYVDPFRIEPSTTFYVIYP